jgi:hypothetical protein
MLLSRPRRCEPGDNSLVARMDVTFVRNSALGGGCYACCQETGRKLLFDARRRVAKGEIWGGHVLQMSVPIEG